MSNTETRGTEGKITKVHSTTPTQGGGSQNRVKPTERGFRRLQSHGEEELGNGDPNYVTTIESRQRLRVNIGNGRGSGQHVNSGRGL